MNIAYILTQSARAYCDRPAVCLGLSTFSTYTQLQDRSAALAAALKQRNLVKGDRVLIFMGNRPEYIEILFAIWTAGCVAVPLNAKLHPNEVTYIHANCDAALAFTDRPEDVEGFSAVIAVGGPEYNAALQASADLQPAHAAQTDPAWIFYTSGTTGRPKGVMITHAMLQFSAAAGASAVRATKDCVSLASMPLFHIAAMNVSCLPTLFIGGTVIVARAFEPALVLDTVNNEAFGVTHFFAVPAAFNAMRQHEKADKTDYSRLISATSGAETVPPPLVQWWVDHGVCLQEGYGLTETAGQGCLLSHEDVGHKLGSAGKFLIHSRMKIMKDRETEAAPGETGEIWMRGNVITPGYWNRPEANEDAFVGEWFRTGDIGKCDEDGFFYIEDRLKDMYISGGENVYPAEIEGVLYGMDAIREVSVIGIPHDTWGETGCAIVAPKDGVEITLESIVAHCEGQLAKFKQPTKLIMIDALPRNATGKVLKYQLREKFSKADA